MEDKFGKNSELSTSVKFLGGSVVWEMLRNLFWDKGWGAAFGPFYNLKKDTKPSYPVEILETT